MVLQWQAHVHLTIQVPVLPTTQVHALLRSLALAHPPMLQMLMVMAIPSFHGSKISHLDHHQHPLPSFPSYIFILAPSALLSLLHLALQLPEHPDSKPTGRIRPLVPGGVVGSSTPSSPLPPLQALAARFLTQVGLLGLGFPRAGQILQPSAWSLLTHLASRKRFSVPVVPACGHLGKVGHVLQL